MTSDSLAGTPHDRLLDPAEHKRQQEIRTGIGVHDPESGSFQFYGPASHFCFLDRIYQRIDRIGHVGMPKGVRKWRLHHFMFDFRNPHGPLSDTLAEIHIRKEMGDGFIAEYFKTIHPQAPVLLRSEIDETWSKLWSPPAIDRKPLKGKELVFLVLAIGARASSVAAKSDACRLENWAAYFAERADTSSTFMLGPTLKGIHFMVLKAMYAFQLMKQNDGYLYLGFAARSALALGMHKREVVRGNSYSQHRLRATFWTIYGLERIVSLFTGRPSSFHDDQIDASYPDDIIDNPNAKGSCAEFAAARASADMGRIANKIASDIYSPRSGVKRTSDLLVVHAVAHQCTDALESLAHSLPSYLQFYDPGLPLGADWQEVQRTFLGMWYHLMHILIHRPALTYATFFSSRFEAQETAGTLLDINASVAASVASAKAIIQMANDACCKRAPFLKSDGSVAFFLLVASITLLYDVLDPATTPGYARSTFEVVESAIGTLETMQHVGPNNSKELSLDIMKFAKDALASGGEEVGLERDLTGAFPWLSNVFAEPFTGFPSMLTEDMIPPDVQQTPEYPAALVQDTRDAADGGVTAATVASGTQYISQWPPSGEGILDIPDSLM
ncbi:c6 transcription factor [Diplodia corticola]|uniref:C6 transcription factor n=1 Tax=Diplodia corticola TaxID=236234 RepID=A0A1J9SLY5_9PEZI|nr:c6 transcription factor [Diplodia corticola]OJD40621.1 c6 transcription factor [Diplodia corticola]